VKLWPSLIPTFARLALRRLRFRLFCLWALLWLVAITPFALVAELGLTIWHEFKPLRVLWETRQLARRLLIRFYDGEVKDRW
jgi:hypothetical protein